MLVSKLNVREVFVVLQLGVDHYKLYKMRYCCSNSFTDIIGALDLLVEQGQWTRCIEKAKSHSAPVLHKYVAIYASHLIKDKLTIEALNLYTTHGVPAMPQNFNVYNQIAINIFSMPNISGPEHYDLWSQLRQMLYELVISKQSNNYFVNHYLIR